METSGIDRLNKIDNIKFLAITLMVVGHFIDQLVGTSEVAKGMFIFIYSFHMPLFIYIGGLLHKNEGINRKITFYMIVGFLLRIYLFVVDSMISDSAGISLFKGNNVSWYMFALAAFTALSYFTRKANRKFILVAGIVIALFAGYDKSIGDNLYLARIIYFYPFYVLGEITNIEKLLSLTKKNWVKILSAGIIVGAILLCIFKLDDIYVIRPLLTGRNNYTINELFMKWGVWLRLLTYGISALLIFAIFGVVPDIKIPLVTDFGKRTLQVYFWHRPILSYLVYLDWAVIMGATNYGIITWIVLAVLLTLLLSIKPFGKLFEIIKEQCEPKSKVVEA